jgi:radical SAM protein with 4Fe4S-binding SPASM domain
MQPAATPTELWIELTSKCPFSCVFCSRELIHGKGEHMDFALYKSLIEQLSSPQVIRLNYSGESIHYPCLIQAIELAKSTCARVELVSALSSVGSHLIEPLIKSGLDQLSISIHTLDPKQYRDIYRFSSVKLLLDRLRQLRETQLRLRLQTPQIDFAFVAMARNLNQLQPLLVLAGQFKIRRLNIYPVIRRDPIPERFKDELDETNRLRSDFLESLSRTVSGLQKQFPDIDIFCSTPELKPPPIVNSEPHSHPFPLPSGARIHSCDQNPRHSVHVLANGDIVSCEVRDHLPLGNLHNSTLAQIWHGDAYQRFRRDYIEGQDEKCRECVYKKIYIPQSKMLRLGQSAIRYLLYPVKQPARSMKIGSALPVTCLLSLGLDTTSILGRICRSFQKTPSRPPLPEAEDGISIIIPERDAPDLLKVCLDNALEALGKFGGQGEIIVVVNGCEEEDYEKLRRLYKRCSWIFCTQPLGFSAAVGKGLDAANYNWVFLLNNDMRLDRDALRRVWLHRAPFVFSIACQIFFQDPAKRREETGLTALDPSHGLSGLYDRLPFSANMCLGHLYSGGGASLFQRRVLQKLVDTKCVYFPLFWEDVNWGILAQQHGYESLFEPAAVAHHSHRATVSRFYSPAEVGRIMERNALICGLTHAWYRPGIFRLSADLVKHRRDFLQPWRLFRLFRLRFSGAAAKYRARYIDQNLITLYPMNRNGDLPWLILISPYALYPRSGSATRIDAVAHHLAKHFRIVLIADEGWTFQSGHIDKLSCFDVVHLLASHRKEGGNSRLERMHSHARPALREEIKRAIDTYHPHIVQVEHEELCGLIDLRDREHWFITLHDVNFGQSKKADGYLLGKLRHYDGVIACSKPDCALLGQKATLIENGVDTHRFYKGAFSSGLKILFIGGFSYSPNRLGVQQFIEKCLDRILDVVPGAKLTVLGGLDGIRAAKQSPFNHPNAEYVPYTDDVSSYLDQAAITINPLKNIRGSCLKNLESLAAGRVCVSTKDAARGWIEYHLPGLLIAENDRTFTHLVIEMLKNPGRRHTLEAQMPQALQKFDWASRAQQQLELYNRV